MGARRAQPPKRARPQRAPPPGPRRPPWPGVVLGAVFAAVAVGASLVLVGHHITGLAVPGCGPGEACDQAAESVWGTVPVVRWPVSFLGLAYFAGALAGWLAAGGALPRSARHVVRAGALASLVFCAIIALELLFCRYCIVAHLANFAFWITTELSRARTARAARVWAVAGATFALVSVAVGAWDRGQRAATLRRGERERDESVRQMIERSRGPEVAAAEPGTRPAGPPEGSAATRAVVESRPVATEPSSRPAGVEAGPGRAAAEPDGRPFEGRYRWGPEAAPIRIVMFTAYQCPDCRRIETDLRALMAERNDLAVSIKHFPLTSECNPGVQRTTQPNGCWAARAAEAAGILWGVEGFWKMHAWLFDRRGVFETQAELEEGIRSLGYDPRGFVQVMSSRQTLERVQADCAEARRLGLYFTPMIFINGVELKGWHVPQALRRSVAELAATGPPPRTAAHDRPPLAFEKYVADWREEPVRTLPPDAPARTLGAAEPRVDIVLWGDYQEPFTAEADGIIRAFVAGRPEARYTFRHFPFNGDCNPQIQERRHPRACRAAQAAEAAGLLGGAAAYWGMHTWLMEHQAEFSDQTLRAAAATLGLDADALLAALDRPEVQAAIADDIEAARQLPRLRLGVPPGVHSIPTIFVNGRYIPRWRLDEAPVLQTILDEAAGR